MPAGGDGFGFGIKQNALFAVGVQVAAKRIFPSGKREKRQGNRNWQIDSHLSGFYAVLEFARRRAACGKNRRAVAIRIRVRQRNRLVQIFRFHCRQDRTENFLAINGHLRADIRKQSRTEPVAARKIRNFAIRTVQQTFRAVLIAFLN